MSVSHQEKIANCVSDLNHNLPFSRSTQLLNWNKTGGRNRLGKGWKQALSLLDQEVCILQS